MDVLFMCVLNPDSIMHVYSCEIMQATFKHHIVNTHIFSKNICIYENNLAVFYLIFKNAVRYHLYMYSVTE